MLSHIEFSPHAFKSLDVLFHPISVISYLLLLIATFHPSFVLSNTWKKQDGEFQSPSTRVVAPPLTWAARVLNYIDARFRLQQA